MPHRALLIQEVVHRIVDVLSPRNPAVLIPKNTRVTLLNVALTCRSFIGPALDALWYSIDDLTVLFKLLPNFLASDGIRPGIIWDHILETDIQTFNSYASRIRSYIQQRTSHIDISAFIDILKACNRSYLLPNLQYLSPMLSGSAEFPFLTSPSLRAFNCTKWDRESLIGPRSMLNSLRKSSPNLADLFLQSVELDPLGLSALNAFTRLEELTIGYTRQTATIHVEFLLNISCRTSLRRLALSGHMVEVVSPSSIMPSQIRFPALEAISFACRITMAALTTFLCSATFPVLESLTACPDAQPDDEAEYWHRFFDSVGDVTTKKFKKLHLYHSGRTSAQLTLSSLPKLSRLSLTNFCLRSEIFGSIRREDIITIINSWPLLENLSLSGSRTNINLSVSILIDIAMGLPLLRQLTLSIDCDNLSEVDDMPILSHELDFLELTLCNSNSGQLQDMAESVDRLFPHLRVCSIWPELEVDGDDLAHWDRIESIIKMLQRARKVEATRIGSGVLGGAQSK